MQMPEKKITDEQFILIEVLMAARKHGVNRMHRQDILSNEKFSMEGRAVLIMAALTMHDYLLTWHTHDEFGLTDACVKMYEITKGKRKIEIPDGPTMQQQIAEVIYLPDRSGQTSAQ